jgi:hypothetical protein
MRTKPTKIINPLTFCLNRVETCYYNIKFEGVSEISNELVEVLTCRSKKGGKTSSERVHLKRRNLVSALFLTILQH